MTSISTKNWATGIINGVWPLPKLLLPPQGMYLLLPRFSRLLCGTRARKPVPRVRRYPTMHGPFEAWKCMRSHVLGDFAGTAPHKADLNTSAGTTPACQTCLGHAGHRWWRAQATFPTKKHLFHLFSPRFWSLVPT
jgi:hypothetical protein